MYLYKWSKCTFFTHLLDKVPSKVGEVVVPDNAGVGLGAIEFLED